VSSSVLPARAPTALLGRGSLGLGRLPSGAPALIALAARGEDGA